MIWVLFQIGCLGIGDSIQEKEQNTNEEDLDSVYCYLLSSHQASYSASDQEILYEYDGEYTWNNQRAELIWYNTMNSTTLYTGHIQLNHNKCAEELRINYTTGYSYSNYTEYIEADWCKVRRFEIDYDDTTIDDIVTNYSWEGNRQESDNGYSEYNDMGYVTKTVGYNDDTEYLYEYDCDNYWCKTIRTTTDGIVIDHQWDGNTMQSENGGYYIYNQYGALLETKIINENSTTEVYSEFDCQ
ncbi:MAG: hypothetical protein CL916_03050 [Deltaproteobacteria bacterium]|nr:hypothetical protein [Deltaproteobacteria bacterium]